MNIANHDDRIRENDATDALPVGELAARARTILVKRFWWFVAVAALVLAATVVMTRYQRPIYAAHGSLLIDRAPPKVLSGVNEVVSLGASSYWGGQQYYQAQKEILSSREVAQMVIDRNGLASDEHFLGLDLIKTELTAEQRRDMVANADPAGRLASRIHVELGENTMIARVSIEDTDPQFAANLVNWVFEAYRDRNLEQRRRATREAYEDLRTILRDMERKKNASEAKLFEFETANDLSTNRRKAVAERLMALDERVRNAQAKRFTAQQQLKMLKRLRTAKNLISANAPGLDSDSLLSQFKQRYVELTLARKEVESLYLPKHPKLQAIDRQIEHLESAARRHIRAFVDNAKLTYQAAAAEEKEAMSRLEEVRREDKWLRGAKTQHELLTAQRDEDKLFYNMVANRLAETDLTGQVEVNNVSVLDAAIAPRVPVRPRKMLNYLLGAILAIIAGFAAALAAELLDNTLKDRFEVENVLKVPYLGAIPTFAPFDGEADEAEVPPNKVDLYAHFRPNSRVAEASRSLRTNILFMRPDNPPRTLVVTSAHPREGKTTTSATLSIALAAASGSAILVDTDLRKPRLHKAFGLHNNMGVTSYVLGRGQPVTALAQQTEVPGLHLLACGPIPPNASEILHTERFRELIEELKNTYDNVIFDSPPVQIVSDAMILATQVDGVIVVAHSKVSKRKSVEETLNSLRSVKANLLGVVLSRTEQLGHGYGYYYGRGYRSQRAYRYRYAADPAEEAATENPPTT
jgi:succinoglycan biosynthesis transport protein ExoP